MNVFIQISSAAVVMPQTNRVEKVFYGLDASGGYGNTIL
jgi:hypothetical protein